MMFEFKVINASFSESYGDSNGALGDADKPINKPESVTCLTYEICTTGHLHFATGGNLREMRGFINITPDAEWKEGADAIGGMSDDTHNDSFYIYVGLPKSQFDNLNRAACLGHLPSQILVEVKSKYLNSLTEVWNNTGSLHALSVVEVKFRGLLAGVQLDNFGNQSHDNFLTPIRLQNSLITQLVQKANTRISWLITVIAILGTLMVVLR